MKPIARFTLLAASAVLMFAGNAHAQLLGPSIPVTGDDSVSTNGTEVWGGTTGGSYTLANGVSFVQFNNSNFVTFPGSGVQVDQDGAAYGNQAGNLGFADGQLNNALGFGDATGAGGQLFLNIKGLTPGHVYIIQAFAAMTNGGNANGNGNLFGSETVTAASGLFSGFFPGSTQLSWGQSPDPTVSGASSITDTLIAGPAGTAFLEFSNTAGTAYELLDAAQIRDITAVPEPSAYALMFAGLALLGFCVRRKSAFIK